MVTGKEENSFPEYSVRQVGDILCHESRQIEWLPHPLAERNGKERSNAASRHRPDWIDVVLTYSSSC